MLSAGGINLEHFNTYADIPSIVEVCRDEGQEAIKCTCMAFKPFLLHVSIDCERRGLRRDETYL